MIRHVVVFYLSAFALLGCGSARTKLETTKGLDVARILRQVNNAVENSIDPGDKDFPPVTSVTLDLQVSVATTFNASAKLPLDMITAGVKVDKENLHHITLTFVPTPQKSDSESARANKDSRLATAIRAVYKSVAHASNDYKFQHGSITLQCTLKLEADAGIDILGLVPIQADTSSSDQSIQSLTLNFGSDPSKTPTLVPAAAPKATPES